MVYDILNLSLYSVAIEVYIMSLRTYLPTLRLVARAVCRYINDNYDGILRHIGEGNANKLDAANTACAILVAALDAEIPNPT